MSFMIVITTLGGPEATTPPSYAMPASVGSPVMEDAPVVRRHEPTARNGLGSPVGVSGELFTTIGRTVINEYGLAWWQQFVFNDTPLPVSKSVTVKLFDPLQGGWFWYTGLAWRPTFTATQAGNRVRDFRIHISNLVAIESPE